MSNPQHSSKSNEWYTPIEYVDAARRLMGAIDLDPASCEFANQTVQARNIFTLETNGMAHNWIGRVWLNPPYGKTNNKSNQGLWTNRLLSEYAKGNTTEAVLLVNAAPSGKWFPPLWAFPICFTSRRIRFVSPQGKRSQPTHSNCIVYLGPNESGFVDEFSRFGVVAKAIVRASCEPSRAD